MIVDADVLIYAVDEDAEFHEASKTWLETALNGSTRVGFPWPSLLAFQRITTHPRASANPLTPAKAWSFITDWLEADQSWIPIPGDRHAELLGSLLADDIRGNLITDAHLAALALEHGVGVCSFDSDFARFPDLRWVHPLRG